jgi:ABC-type phosphate/phosphonate transport system permease subunit
MIKEYLQYIKDNPNRYWFRAKLYGWGWTPARWQGWVVTLAFIVFIAWSVFALVSQDKPSANQLTWFFVKFVLASIVLMIICYKTGEKPRWQWGLPKNKN